MWTKPLHVSDSLGSDISPNSVGNKAYNLMIMSELGLPIPKGFVIGIGERFTREDLINEMDLYGLQTPVSVRSGAPVSMPGMMDTILNVGVCDHLIDEMFEDRAFGLDCYARLIETMSTSIFGADRQDFDEILNAANRFYIDDALAKNQKIVELYKVIANKSIGKDFFPDPYDQLYIAAMGVQDSWNSQRAIDYRRSEGIDDGGGTAIIIQEMVFGNRNDRSGTGVVFSHNPNTGKPGLYGDFMTMAQGEDIVSGSKIPMAIESMVADPKFKKNGKELQSYIGKLLRRFKYIQDVEFTIDNGQLFILQTRKGKCSPKASIRSALSLVTNGSMSVAEATDLVLESIPDFGHGSIHINESNLMRLGFGMGVSDGVVAGVVASTSKYAEFCRINNQPYIFCSTFTSPDDTEVMRHSVGVLTAKGGRLSHAAVLARSMSKPTVVGFDDMTVTDKGIVVDEVVLENGSKIQIDGEIGGVYYEL
jgi:pyruvate,orthophosphate dikinase